MGWARRLGGVAGCGEGVDGVDDGVESDGVIEVERVLVPRGGAARAVPSTTVPIRRAIRSQPVGESARDDRAGL
jgi:hypothetical protein